MVNQEKIGVTSIEKAPSPVSVSGPDLPHLSLCLGRTRFKRQALQDLFPGNLGLCTTWNEIFMSRKRHYVW